MNSEISCPRVSVIMPSFNHERFIRSAIMSVLNQTMPELELLIVDDGSTDRSQAIISEIDDPRIHCKLLTRNYGACEAMNIGLRLARGRFVAVCNSDDEWEPDKLQRQLEVFQADTRTDAVFSDVFWIDDHGAPLDGRHAPPHETIFRQCNRSRGAWMRDLLENGNMLCHPSVLIRRDVYGTVGEYDNRLRQLPDLDMWVRILSQYDIFVMPAKLVRFRIHESNTSRPRPEASRRSINEHCIILRKIFSCISVDNFRRAFGFIANSIDDEIDFQIEKALYLLKYEGIYRGIFRQLGLEILYDVMGNATGTSRLSLKYGYDVFAFHREMAVHSPWIEEARHSYVETMQRHEALFDRQARLMNATIQALRNSTSWRVTAPLRAVKRLWQKFCYSKAGYPIGLIWRLIMTRSLASLRYWRAEHVIARSGLFDSDWYLANNPDVMESGINPIYHYVAFGAPEGRDPIPSFSTKHYLSRNPDVAAAGLNPFSHFILSGSKERRMSRLDDGAKPISSIESRPTLR